MDVGIFFPLKDESKLVYNTISTLYRLNISEEVINEMMVKNNECWVGEGNPRKWINDDLVHFNFYFNRETFKLQEKIILENSMSFIHQFPEFELEIIFEDESLRTAEAIKLGILRDETGPELYLSAILWTVGYMRYVPKRTKIYSELLGKLKKYSFYDVAEIEYGALIKYNRGIDSFLAN